MQGEHDKNRKHGSVATSQYVKCKLGMVGIFGRSRNSMLESCLIILSSLNVAYAFFPALSQRSSMSNAK